MAEIETYAEIVIGTWADTVLEKLGKPSDIINLGNNPDDEAQGYVVEWIYREEGVKFTMARGIRDDLFYGHMTIYSVQKIEAI
jgi:hypothetical protein